MDGDLESCRSGRDVRRQWAAGDVDDLALVAGTGPGVQQLAGTIAERPGGVSRQVTVLGGGVQANAPGFDALCASWVEEGRNVGSMTARTVKLLDLYGAEIFSAALQDLLARGAHDIGALAHLCELRRRARSLPVPVDVKLPSHVRDRDVVPHQLGSYDDDDD